MANTRKGKERSRDISTLRESKKMCWKIIDLFSLLNLKTIWYL